MSDIQARKQQHLVLAMDERSQGNLDLWKEVGLPYKTLPEINLADVDTAVNLLGKKINQPLIIGSMTGGSEHAAQINTNLAIAAEQMRVGLGVGSQRVALEKADAKKTFELVRKYAPTTVVFANMGAVQLNYGHTVESYKRVVDMISADGLYLHINPMQEALQPEGDTNFEFLISKIEKLVKEIGVPVFAKEVGGGIDVESARKLVNVGVAGIDVAGVGGTSWTWIEGMRRQNDRLTSWFSDAGYRTDELLPKIRKECPEVMLVASGGVRSPIQGLKAMIMGANYYSAARPFLGPAMDSAEEVVRLVADWESGFRIALFGTGKKKPPNGGLGFS